MKYFLVPILFIYSISCLFCVNLLAQPINDECVSAIDISAAFQGVFGDVTTNGPLTLTGGTPGANDPPEPGEAQNGSTGIGPYCPTETDGNLFGDAAEVWEQSVWFSWTVPDLNGDGSPVSYSFWTSDGSFGDDCGLNPSNILSEGADTQIAIYEGVCPTAATGPCDHYAANEDLLTVEPWISGFFDIQFTPGTTYYMAVDGWDGVEGDFCFTVVIGGVECGDNVCAPVETYCDCVDCQSECSLGNISVIEYDETANGFFFADDLLGNIFFCSEFVNGISGSNIYLGFGALNFTDCQGMNNGVNITLSNGSFPGINPNADGTYTMPSGSVFYIELTPADIAAGSITITGAVPDGIGNTCSETITINYANSPQVNNPFCTPTCFAGGIDENLLTNGITVCEDGELSLCTNGLEDLTLPCEGGMYGYYWRVYVNPYGDWVNVSGWIELGTCPTIPVSDLFIDRDGSLAPNFLPGSQIEADPYGTGNPLQVIIEAAALCIDSNGDIIDGCTATNGPDFFFDVNGTNRTVIEVEYYPAGDPNCDTVDVMGCTDTTACNFDATATVDDGTCLTNDCEGTCGGAAIEGTTCTDANGNIGMYAADCSCDLPGVLGCTDPTACNYDASATVDDGTCLMNDCEGTCGGAAIAGAACTDINGNTGIYAADCSCDLTGIAGCTDTNACNFDSNATIDDGTCLFNDCEGICGGVALPGETCTDANGNQSTYEADCSCPVCEEEISGAIVVSTPDCDVSGINITIIAADGTSITATTDVDGNFVVPGGPFQCGTYTAAFEDIATLPSCFLETGSTEPVVFTLDGNEGTGVDVAFFSNLAIPTLSQWGLIIFALLLMSFGAISLLGKQLKARFI